MTSFARIACLLWTCAVAADAMAAAPPAKPRSAARQAAPAARAAARPTPAEAPDLAPLRALIKREQYDVAIEKLRKMDEAAGGARTDVALLLAVAYYRMGAYKDAGAVARRLVDPPAKDPSVLAQAYVLLGRSLSDTEKKPVNKESEPLIAAEDAFRKGIAATGGGTSEAARLALAVTLYRLERGEEARVGLRELADRPGVTDATAERARQLLQNPKCATEACLPRLSFVSADGHYTTGDELKGKVVLLSFWATWCGPCVASMPELKKVYARYQTEPFVLIGVNRDSEKATMDAFMAKNGVAWPQISDDASDRLSDAMAVRGIPAEMLFDHEGILLDRTTGWGAESGTTLALRIHEALSRARKAQAGPP